MRPTNFARQTGGVTPGSLILINGPSSAGKSTLARALQGALPAPFLHFSLDFILFGADILPRTPEGKLRDWQTIRPHVFEGFNRCLPALLTAGNNLVVDYIAETPAMWAEFQSLTAGHDVFLVGLHVPLAELQRREEARGDRRAGDAERDLLTVHSFTPYHLDVDGTAPVAENAARIIAAWQARA